MTVIKRKLKIYKGFLTFFLIFNLSIALVRCKLKIFLLFRQFYLEGETKEFENIENEWPIFFIFMIIDGIFKNLPDQVEEYRQLLKLRIQTDSHGGKIYNFSLCYKNLL